MDQTLKILVIRFSSIGDIVLTTPIIRCLKKQLPQAEIHFLIKKNFYPVIRNNPNIDKVYCYTGSFHQTLKELQEEKYNYIIDLQHNIRSNRFKRQLGVQSFTVNKINFKKWLYVTFKLNFLPKKHIVDRYFETVQTLNVFNDGQGLEFYSTKEADEVLTFLNENLRKGYLLFVVGAAHNTKQIPQNKAIEIINDAEKPVVLVGGESDRAKAEELCRELTVEYYNFTGKTTLEQTAVLIREAKVVITPDTGAMHIAAAYNKPIVSLWGNTVPEFGMYPYMPESNNRYYLAEVKLPCRPCTKIGYNRCPLGHFNCMQKQNIEAILSKIKEFWEIE